MPTKPLSLPTFDAAGRPSFGRPHRNELARFDGATVPDLMPEELKLLYVGINPSLWTAATGAHFARPGNRFYPALHAAGITDHVIDASAGYRRDDLDLLLRLGIGGTNLVPRATARAAELTRAELRAAPERLQRVVEQHRPRVIAFLGISDFRIAFSEPHAVVGRQPDLWDTTCFVLPNPSGLNAHETIESLGTAYRAAAIAAGVIADGTGG